MFIETSAKAGYNVKQVCFFVNELLLLVSHYFTSLLSLLQLQLFRRVAAALPGMDSSDNKPSEGESKLSKLHIHFVENWAYFLNQNCPRSMSIVVSTPFVWAYNNQSASCTILICIVVFFWFLYIVSAVFFLLFTILRVVGNFSNKPSQGAKV